MCKIIAKRQFNSVATFVKYSLQRLCEKRTKIESMPLINCS